MRLFASVFAVAFSTAAASTLAAQPAMVILVRHAERATAPAADPVLTDAGSQRALALKQALAAAGVSAVVTTQFQRTQLTAKPLADSLGLTPVLVRAGNPLQAHLDSVAAAVKRQAAGSVVLVVGHSNTIPGIVGALGGPKLPDLCDGEYSQLFILHFPATGSPQLVRGNYGAADAPDSGNCTRTMR